MIISVVMIYFQGYLIPGTPKLTKKYSPPIVLKMFDKRIDAGSSSGIQYEKSIERESDINEIQSLSTYFVNHGVLEPCPDSTDLCVTDSFSTSWQKSVDSISDSNMDVSGSKIANLLGIYERKNRIELSEKDEVQILSLGSETIGVWPSRSALIADLAAAKVLQSWIPAWNTFNIQSKGQILDSLRMFIDFCPKTGGDVHMKRETVESCCDSYEIMAVACEDSGDTLFTHRL